ncbi:hypothetical protein MSI_24790 [Treponema sp. JC4]|uniref:hypothetical protein n=1 Tax=Treponema sp. JC4 TaxID=1124982 RepID=UPI00025AFDC8|nr:hypothetical protein [Treponema sp. JC4]EID84078.1 hypothetical protein MSI_24790 [Treponema sp. JC4]
MKKIIQYFLLITVFFISCKNNTSKQQTEKQIEQKPIPKAEKINVTEEKLEYYMERTMQRGGIINICRGCKETCIYTKDIISYEFEKYEDELESLNIRWKEDYSFETDIDFWYKPTVVFYEEGTRISILTIYYGCDLLDYPRFRLIGNKTLEEYGW